MFMRNECAVGIVSDPRDTSAKIFGERRRQVCVPRIDISAKLVEVADEILLELPLPSEIIAKEGLAQKIEESTFGCNDYLPDDAAAVGRNRIRGEFELVGVMTIEERELLRVLQATQSVSAFPNE
jgi:hypothetical protein